MELLWGLFIVGIAPLVAGQATHMITVGLKGSFFDPPTTSALTGDFVTFVFAGDIHSVTQSSFQSPCVALPGGFNSGLIGTEGDAAAVPPVWTIQVTNTSEPIWFFCEATQPQSHCFAGMVGAINAPSQMFMQYQASAKALTSTPAATPTVVLSGIGAFATASPSPSSIATGTTSTNTTIQSATSSFISGSFTPSPVTTSTTPTSAAASKHTSSSAIIGAAVGGGAAVVIIAFLVFLFLRRRTKPLPPPVLPEIAERVQFISSRGNQYPPPTRMEPADAMPFLSNRPSIPILVDGQPYNGAQLRHQQSTERFATGLGRNISYTTTGSSASDRPLTSSGRQALIARDRSPPTHTNPRPDTGTVTIADALSSHPYAQVSADYPSLAIAESQDDVLDRGPNVDVHEIAKEVAALLGPHVGSGAQQNETPAPLTSVPSTHIPTRRPARQLPNPRAHDVQDIRSSDPDAGLPEYQR